VLQYFFRVDNCSSYLPDQRFQLFNRGGQADAERDSVWEAGYATGDNGPFHGEGQHGVDNKHDEQEEGHLEKRKQKWKQGNVIQNEPDSSLATFSIG